MYTAEEQVSRLSAAERGVFNSVLDRLARDPEIDFETIFDDFVSATPRARRLFLQRALLVTFVVQEDRVLVLDVFHGAAP